MAEWAVALVAAGAAIAGSVVTGWYTRSAGIRQAEAARHAGEQQAEALLESVRMTLRGADSQRAIALRRQAYAEFLGAAEARILAERTGRGSGEEGLLLQRAYAAVVIEGPVEVAVAAGSFLENVQRHVPLDDLNGAKLVFVTEAQRATEDLKRL
ncbi:hypothetical protein ACIQNG_36810 [Streptomyces sp. NPDC091377]|uniref:hypothetical protein n=1 Tax=Streptomyces sp. NPDC091377 TaxID=3365995 RepID=UPI00381897E7